MYKNTLWCDWYIGVINVFVFSYKKCQVNWINREVLNEYAIDSKYLLIQIT